MEEVALGLPGSWANDNLEASDHYTTKVGGVPDWPFPESSLGPELLHCNSCTSNLCLIAQVYAPIATETVKIDERVIYIFGCTDVHCGSWRAIRVQKPDMFEEPKSGSLETSHLTESPTFTSDSKLWDDLYSFESESEGDGENEDINMEDLARALSEAANLASGPVKKSTRRQKNSDQSHQLVPNSRRVDDPVLVLPCFYMFYQEDRSGHDLVPAFTSISSAKPDDFQVGKDDDDHNESWEKEKYEYDKALHADRTYLKFKKRVDGCPKQCLRYSFGGVPLLATGVASKSGPCGLCGGCKHYEMQLMPPLVYFLLEGATNVQRELLDNWSWMTLMVYTCSKSCFQKSDHTISNRNGWTVVEETVIAQFE